MFLRIVSAGIIHAATLRHIIHQARALRKRYEQVWGLVPGVLTVPAVYSLKWSTTPFLFIAGFLCFFSPLKQKIKPCTTEVINFSLFLISCDRNCPRMWTYKANMIKRLLSCVELSKLIPDLNFTNVASLIADSCKLRSS